MQSSWLPIRSAYHDLPRENADKMLFVILIIVNVLRQIDCITHDMLLLTHILYNKYIT